MTWKALTRICSHDQRMYLVTGIRCTSKSNNDHVTANKKWKTLETRSPYSLMVGLILRENSYRWFYWFFRVESSTLEIGISNGWSESGFDSKPLKPHYTWIPAHLWLFVDFCMYSDQNFTTTSLSRTKKLLRKSKDWKYISDLWQERRTKYNHAIILSTMCVCMKWIHWI